MLAGFVNHLINPDFFFTDFGTAPRATTGYVVPRWKLDLTGAPGVSAFPAALPADISQDKWLRGKSGLTLDVASIDVGQRVRLTQRIEGGDRFSRQSAHMTLVAYGPDGGSIKYGIGSTSRTMQTALSPAGNPKATTASYIENIDDPATEYLEVFIEPLQPGTYQIAFVQIDWPDDVAVLPSLELRPRQIERTLLNRYSYVVPVGAAASLGSALQTVLVPLPVPMRINPKVVARPGAITVRESLTGDPVTVPSPSYALTDTKPGGCRVRITGAPETPIPATTVGYLSTADTLVLEADY